MDYYNTGTYIIIFTSFMEISCGQMAFSNVEVWPKKTLYLEWNGFMYGNDFLAYRAKGNNTWINLTNIHTSNNTYKTVIFDLESGLYEIMMNTNGQTTTKTIDMYTLKNNIDQTDSPTGTSNVLIGLIVIFVIFVFFLSIIVIYNCKRDYQHQIVADNNYHQHQKWYLQSIPCSSKLQCCNREEQDADNKQTSPTRVQPKNEKIDNVKKKQRTPKKSMSQGNTDNTPSYRDPEHIHSTLPPFSSKNKSSPSETTKNKSHYVNEHFVPPVEMQDDYLTLEQRGTPTIVDKVHEKYLSRRVNESENNRVRMYTNAKEDNCVPSDDQMSSTLNDKDTGIYINKMPTDEDLYVNHKALMCNKGKEDNFIPSDDLSSTLNDKDKTASYINDMMTDEDVYEIT